MNAFGLKVFCLIVAASALLAGCANTPRFGTPTDVVIMDGVMHPVSEGESIYDIASAYEVSPQLLYRVNGFSRDDELKPGLRVFVPGAREYRTVTPGSAIVRAEPAGSNSGSEIAMASDLTSKPVEDADPVPLEQDGLWHMVRPGETLSAIARAYDISVVELQRVNNLPDASELRVGKVLWVPGAEQVEEVEIIKSTVVTPEPIKEVEDDPRVVQEVKPAPTPEVKPEEKSEPEQNFPRAVSEFADIRFQWPLKENFRIIRPYSTSPDSMNAGIDLGAPIGTDVCAAADGKVQLVGGVADDLGGSFGNFIIVYHGKYRNEDVRTIYAHNSQNLVEVGQLVKRGQPIAKVGISGTPPAHDGGGVLHFEIRQSTTAMDPIKVLPSLSQ